MRVIEPSSSPTDQQSGHPTIQLSRVQRYMYSGRGMEIEIERMAPEGSHLDSDDKSNNNTNTNNMNPKLVAIKVSIAPTPLCAATMIHCFLAQQIQRRRRRRQQELERSICQTLLGLLSERAKELRRLMFGLMQANPACGATCPRRHFQNFT